LFFPFELSIIRIISYFLMYIVFYLFFTKYRVFLDYLYFSQKSILLQYFLLIKK
jgi:hypothetical protein